MPRPSQSPPVKNILEKETKLGDGELGTMKTVGTFNAKIKHL